jgi:CDP-diacylglycerol--glycerol-3-phosphate 3-phosphatidyltransferase
VNLPNVLTVIRIFLTFIFIFLCLQEGVQPKLLALVIFTLASLTDFWDGFIARKYNLISQFGKIMDPIADKFLLLSAFYIFTQMRLIAVWIFGLIFAREVIVTGLRLMAMHRGVALAAEEAGKIKTVLQIVLVYSIIIFTILIQLNIHSQGYRTVMVGFLNGVHILIYCVLLSTLWSGILFISNNRKEIFYVR